MQNNSLSTGKNAIYLNALPYLNVLPLNEQQLDLWVLNIIGSELPIQLITSLLKQQTFTIGIDLQDKKQEEKEARQQIKALQQTFEKFSEQPTLSLGYPMLLLEDAALGRDIAAPLFIWELELTPAEDQAEGHWILSYDSQRPLKYNDILKNYLITRFDLDWELLMGAAEELKSKHFLSALSRLAVALQIAQPELPKLYMCPNPQLPAASKNCIYWAGMLGDFEPSPSKIEELPISLQPRESRSWYTRIAALALNSAQEEALEAIFNSDDVLLTGSSSTGKSRTLAAMLPGLLADQGTCLIISQKSATLHDLKYQLEQTGLKNLGILLLQDEDLDKEALLDYLTLLPSLLRNTPKLDEKRYSLLLQQCLEQRQQLVEGYDAMQREVIDGMDWTNAVGQFLQYHLEDGKQYLSRILNASDFEWSASEFKELTQALDQHEPLYQKVNNLYHPLIALQDYIFKEKNLQEAQYFVEHELRLLSRRLRDLYQDYTTFIDAYADELRFHYEGHVKELKYQIQSLLRELKVYREVYGNSFDNMGSLSNTRLRIMSVFSRKHQQIRAAKEQIYEHYDALKELYELKQYFDFDLKPIHSYPHLSDIAKDLQAFEKAAEQWLSRIPLIVRQKVKELTIKLPLKPDLKRRFEDLEQQVDQYLEQLEAKALLSPDFKIKSIKATAREAYLRDLLETIMVLERSLEEFPDFYYWYKDWLNLGEKGQALVKALVAVRPNSWQTAFKSWYYYHYLDRQYSLQLPDAALPIELYLGLKQELEELLISNSLMMTRSRQNEVLRILRKEKSFNPSSAKGQFQTIKLDKLLDWLGFEQLSLLFPIVVARPEMADRLFDKVPLFDLVVLEDAHLLDEQLGRRLSKLGAQRLIIGQGQASGPNYLTKAIAQGQFRQFRLESEYSKNAQDQAKVASALQGPLAFQEALLHYLMQYLPAQRLQKSVQVEQGLYIDVLVKPLAKNAAPIAIIIDGWMKTVGKYDYTKAIERAKRLKKQGYICHSIWSIDWWRAPDKALQSLVAFILNWDRESN